MEAEDTYEKKNEMDFRNRIYYLTILVNWMILVWLMIKNFMLAIAFGRLKSIDFKGKAFHFENTPYQNGKGFLFWKHTTLNFKLLQTAPSLHPATHFAGLTAPGTAFGTIQQKIMIMSWLDVRSISKCWQQMQWWWLQ